MPRYYFYSADLYTREETQLTGGYHGVMTVEEDSKSASEVFGEVADLQAAATAAGANSQVITAISFDAGANSNTAAITFLSYGWQADTSTIYEAQVTTVAPSDAQTAAANLASQGYIITAVGIADSATDIVLVGTRVQGDTMPRPFMSTAIANDPTMFQQGYAIVASITYSSPTVADTYTIAYLGER